MMALLQKLKEKLGIGGSASERSQTDTEVTVEHETGTETETSAEAKTGADAESGSDVTPDSEDETDVGADEMDEPIATETEAAASTESLVEHEETSADPTEAAEPAEAAGPESEDTEVAGEDGSSVDSLKGIGPAYAERLSNIGIDSIADLAAADPADVAEGANVGEKRAATWIDRAKEF